MSVSDGYDHLLARLQLKAILPTLATFVRLDDEARDLIAGQHFGVQVATRSGLSTRLDFRDGEVQVDSEQTARRALKLLFLSDWQLIRSFSGNGFAVPVPVGGYSQLGRLRTFTKLTTLMQRVLTASPQQLVERKLLETHIGLLLGAVIPSAIAQLESHDAACKNWLAPYRDKQIQFDVADDTSCWIRFQKGGAVYSCGVPEQTSDVKISFLDHNIALAAIRCDLVQLAAVGKGDYLLVKGP
jgi:hypothetical protein